MLVDSHCHLDFPDFADDLDGVVERAGAAGIGRMVTICTRPSEFAKTRSIAERYGPVYCAVGVHPHEAAKEAKVDVDALTRLTEGAKTVGIGETGLDYFYDNSPREAQAASFRIHCQAARRTGLPLIVHTRDAEEDTVDILEEEAAATGDKPLRGVIHCFTGTRFLAERAVALGFYISISGIYTFKNSNEIREAVAGVPADRLLVETDSPFLAPVPKRGKRNEPALVAHTAARLAEERGLSVDELARLTTENFFTLFDKMDRPPADAAA